MQTIRLTQHEVEKVTCFMQQVSGNDFSDKGSLVSSKVGSLCVNAGYNHFWELWDAMQESTIAASQLRQRIIDELTTSYSYFYREHAHFVFLSNLMATGAVPIESNDLRIWSAGCATGEEAYNLAMTIEDARSAGTMCGGYEVVGSDISTKAIDAARSGTYDLANVARMPPHWRNLYCTRDGRGYAIRDALRRHVKFRHENVFAPRPDSPFDVVVCRNMLIYFDRKSIEKFCSLLRGRVKPGGYLLLGHTEIMGQINGFNYIEPSIWRRKE